MNFSSTSKRRPKSDGPQGVIHLEIVPLCPKPPALVTVALGRS